MMMNIKPFRHHFRVLFFAVCALSLSTASLVGCDCKEEESNVETPTFAQGKDNIWWFDMETQKEVLHGTTLQVETYEQHEFVEMESPFLLPKAGRVVGDGVYQLQVTKLDHLDDKQCGLSQVCCEKQCYTPDNTASFGHKFTISPQTSQDSPLSIHYKISSAKQKVADDYRVKVALLKDSKEVSHFFINFSYRPKQ